MITKLFISRIAVGTTNGWFMHAELTSSNLLDMGVASWHTRFINCRMAISKVRVIDPLVICVVDLDETREYTNSDSDWALMRLRYD